MKTSMIKAIRLHLLMIAVVLCGTYLIAPNQQGLFCAILIMACWGLLWFAIPKPRYIAPLHHDDEPYVAYAELSKDDDTVEDYHLMMNSLEKEAFLRQCGTLN